MRNRGMSGLRGGFLAAMAMAVLSGVVLAQGPRPSAGASGQVPDLSGFWIRPEGVGPRQALYFTTEEPAMLPWAAKKYEVIRKGLNSMTTDRPEYGHPEFDPSQHPYCMPFGFPRVFAYSDGFEIVQVPGRVYINFESGAIQRIYTDGRTRAKGPPLTFMGQSIGRWEGDTLVVETTDINDITWLDSMGHLHTDALRVEQRIRRIDHDTLEMDFLFDDPKTYSKPWKGKRVFQLQKGNETLYDYFLCEDPTRQEFEENVLNKKEGQ